MINTHVNVENTRDKMGDKWAVLPPLPERECDAHYVLAKARDDFKLRFYNRGIIRLPKEPCSFKLCQT